MRPLGRQKKSVDYINANFIDGYQRTRAFIGTQGPLPSTFDCFWRMIWEQRVAIIVMITNLVERGRRKCDMYWPKDGIETYGIIQVKLVQEDVMATYTVRTFIIKHLKLAKKNKNATEKTVYQYHYTNWPDHGMCHRNQFNHQISGKLLIFICFSYFLIFRNARSSIASAEFCQKISRGKST